MLLIPSGAIWPKPVAAAGNTVTWNPSDKNAGITLSNGNLDATVTGGFVSVRATVGHGSGAYYFEMERIIVGGNAYVVYGVGDSGANLASYVGNSANSIGTRLGDQFANGFTQDDTTALGGTDSVNDVLMFALDIDNKKIWRGLNGTWLNGNTPTVNGATQWAHWTGALTLYPMVALLETGTTPKVRIHQTNTYSAPSGFSQWG